MKKFIRKLFRKLLKKEKKLALKPVKKLFINGCEYDGATKLIDKGKFYIQEPV